MDYPTYADVLAARDFTRPYLPQTPLIYSWKLSRLLGCEYYIKCENIFEEKVYNNLIVKFPSIDIMFKNFFYCL